MTKLHSARLVINQALAQEKFTEALSIHWSRSSQEFAGVLIGVSMVARKEESFENEKSHFRENAF